MPMGFSLCVSRMQLSSILSPNSDVFLQPSRPMTSATSARSGASTSGCVARSQTTCVSRSVVVWMAATDMVICASSGSKVRPSRAAMRANHSIPSFLTAACSSASPAPEAASSASRARRCAMMGLMSSPDRLLFGGEAREERVVSLCVLWGSGKSH